MTKRKQQKPWYFHGIEEVSCLPICSADIPRIKKEIEDAEMPDVDIAEILCSRKKKRKRTRVMSRAKKVTKVILQEKVVTPSPTPKKATPQANILCDVCKGTATNTKRCASRNCKHEICRTCWERESSQKQSRWLFNCIWCPVGKIWCKDCTAKCSYKRHDHREDRRVAICIGKVVVVLNVQSCRK